MKRMLAGMVLSTVLLSGGAAVAAVQTVTLSVANMTCASCPYIVEKTLAAVPGVSQVDVSFEEKTAVVTFDDAQTTPEALAAASTNAGYPARPVGGDAQ